MRFFFLILTLVLSSSVAMAQLNGIVVERKSGKPIEGARVRISTNEPLTHTDASGNFSLNDTDDYPFKLTAAAFGYFNGWIEVTSENDTLRIEMDPISTNVVEGHPLNSPDRCAFCHVEKFWEWRDMPMAKTGMNRWVFDVLDGTGTSGGQGGFVYKRDSVHREAKPNSDCSACHSPIHWLTDIENAGMGDVNNPTTDMQLGVQCEVCHRALDVSKPEVPGVDPQSFTLLRGPQSLEFGLLGDTTFDSPPMRAAYNPLLAAKLCAACHEDTNDHDDDNDYQDEGSVPHETTYSEWLTYFEAAGENGQTCIDCHMPYTQETAFCSFEPKQRRPGTIRSHDIRGTNPEFLNNAVTATASVSEGITDLSVNVSITNDKTGHSVPSGVVIRNMLLVVIATDENGNQLTQISGDRVDDVGGVGDPDQGYYANQAGYAFYLNMTDGKNERVFYTESTAIAKDSRLKAGETYSNTFVFSLGENPAKLVDVQVRLIYRRAYRQLVDAKNWTLTGLGDPLVDIQAPDFGHRMFAQNFQIDVCAAKNVTGSNAIEEEDYNALLALWGKDAPFCADTIPTTDIRHFISLLDCL